MTYKHSYIKEIENHFLFLVGKGIMLSPRDYDLIGQWKKRGIPKEVVYKGINKALEDFRKKKGSGELPRTLAYCVLSIEGEISNYRRITEDKLDRSETNKKYIIENIIQRLAEIIKLEKREKIRGHYIEARNMVCRLLTNSNEEDIFEPLDNIEEEFYETFFQTLPKGEKDRIKQMAESMIDKKRERLMSERARYESILSFRNEILKRDYELKNIISYD
jgi:hypothetical protein